MEDNTVNATAEVIESTSLDIVFTPAVLKADFDGLEAAVDEMIAGYESAKYDLSDPVQKKQANLDRRYLNDILEAIESRRKSIKNQYMEPLDAFEARVKTITSKVKSAKYNIIGQIDEAERIRKENLYQQLYEHYMEVAELLAPVVPYERIHEKQWLNVSFGFVKATNAIDAKVQEIAKNWNELKSQRDSISDFDGAERVFFETLDINQAYAYCLKTKAQQKRIEEMKQAVAENIEAPAQTEEEVAVQPVTDSEQTVSDTKPSVPNQTPSVPSGESLVPDSAPLVPPAAPSVPNQAMPVSAPYVPEAMPGGQFQPYVMVIKAASREQLKAIGEFCATLTPRVSGRFIAGTLGEAWEKQGGIHQWL